MSIMDRVRRRAESTMRTQRGLSDVQGGMEEFGLDQFSSGGSLGPERVNALFNAQAGPMPYMQAPSLGGMQQYGMAAQDMAARAAALQSGQAYNSMGGMNPAARAAAASQVAQSAAGGVGQAGVQGMMQGGQFMQNAAQANYGGQMQDRMGQRGMFDNALGRTQQIGMYGMGAKRDYMQQILQFLQNQQLAQDAKPDDAMQLAGTVGGFFI